MKRTNVSVPRGLRGFGSDDERFVRFFSIVQDAASQEGCVFFCWAGGAMRSRRTSLRGRTSPDGSFQRGLPMSSRGSGRLA